MSSVSKIKLSGSSDGELVLVTATNSTGALTIHTCTSSSGANTWDEVYLYAFNNSTGSRGLTVEFGSTTGIAVVTMTTKSGMNWIVPGSIGHRSLVVKAFATSGASITVGGYVNQVAS